MKRSALGKLGFLSLFLALVACGDDDADETTAPAAGAGGSSGVAESYEGLWAGPDGESAVFKLTVGTGSGTTAHLLADAPRAVNGTMFLSGIAGEISLTGAFTPGVELNFFGKATTALGSFSCTGKLTDGTLRGVCKGADGRERPFDARRLGVSTISRYCGKFAGSAEGSLNLLTAGNDAAALIYNDTLVGVAPGTYLGSGVSLSLPQGGTATGTVAADAVSGSWSHPALGNGTWQASKAACPTGTAEGSGGAGGNGGAGGEGGEGGEGGAGGAATAGTGGVGAGGEGGSGAGGEATGGMSAAGAGGSGEGGSGGSGDAGAGGEGGAGGDPGAGGAAGAGGDPGTAGAGGEAGAAGGSAGGASGGAGGASGGAGGSSTIGPIKGADVVVLGAPPPNAGGIVNCRGWGLSYDGSVVAGTCIESGGSAGVPVGDAYVWVNGVGKPLPRHDAGYVCGAYGVSGDGRVVFGECASAGGAKVIWVDGGQAQLIDPYDTGTGAFVRFNAINKDGSMLAGIGGDESQAGRAFRWKGGAYDQLYTAPTTLDISEAYGMSADGKVVVGSKQSATGVSAFRWTEAGGAELISDNGFFATCVSHDGDTVHGEGFRWTKAGGFKSVPNLGYPRATNVDGSVVVLAQGAMALVLQGDAVLAPVTLLEASGNLSKLTVAAVNEPRGITPDGTKVVATTGSDQGERVIVLTLTP